jgi:hypothetical protein
MGTDKKVGDWIVLFGDEVYQIRNDATIFKSNKLATKEEIKKWKNLG